MAKKLSDIKAPKIDRAHTEDVPKTAEKRAKKEAKQVPVARAEAPAREENELEKIDKWFEKFERQKIKRFHEEDSTKKQAQAKRKKLAKRVLIFAILAFLVSGALAYAIAAFFSRTTISFVVEEFPFRYEGMIIGSASVSGVDVAGRIIPAEIFSVEKNETRLFKAHGEEYVERKARGVITVHNGYSSSPQRLTARTRFAAPDGKIFRLDTAITVPGAKIEGGNIIPSSIDAAVTADKPGEEYNIGPVAKFTIPGFFGTDRYEGFHGSSSAPMTGGFMGRVAVPTSEDITRARTETTSGLKDSIHAFLISQIPEEFIVLDPAISFETVRTSVNTNTNVDKEFSFTASGKTSAVAFREADIEILMADVFNSTPEMMEKGHNMSLRRSSVSYGEAAANFAKKQISIEIDFNGAFWSPPDADKIAEAIRGKKESEIRAILYGVPLVKQIKVAFWPRFVKTAPRDLSRVHIVIE